MTPLKKLTPKQLSVIEFIIANPLLKKIEIAKHFNVTNTTIVRYLQDPLFSEELDKRLKESWHSASIKAQERMIEALDSVDQKVRLDAAKYILNSCGYASPIEVNVNQNEVRIIVKPENED